MSAQPPKLIPEDRLRFFEKMAADTMGDCFDQQPMLEQLTTLSHLPFPQIQRDSIRHVQPCSALQAQSVGS